MASTRDPCRLKPDGHTSCVDEPTSAEPGASMSETDLLAVLADTFSVLGRWQLLVRSRVEPAEYSDLAADDEVWP